MDNLYFKKLPSEELPTVRPGSVVTKANDVVIVETASGKLYRCDSSGAKRLMSVDEEHPVGDLYIQFDGTPTPAAKYGGTWVEDETYAGRTFVGSGAGYTLGATGGEAEHILTIDEMPSHGHARLTNPSGVEFGSYVSGDGGQYSAPQNSAMKWDGTNIDELYTGNMGGSQPHNIIQPYKVITIWKRTA